MIRVEPFKPEHLELIALQPRHHQFTDHCDRAALELLASHGAVSAFIEDELMVCGGIISIDREYPLLWSLISADAGKHMLAICRGVERFLDTSRHPAIYASCDPDFEQGCRLMRLLGFERLMQLPPLAAFGGEAHLLFCRSRPWVQ